MYSSRLRQAIAPHMAITNCESSRFAPTPRWRDITNGDPAHASKERDEQITGEEAVLQPVRIQSSGTTRGNGGGARCLRGVVAILHLLSPAVPQTAGQHCPSPGR